GGAMELVAELRGRDGQTRSVRVPCPAEEGEGGQLRGLRRGLAELQERVVELLAPLDDEEDEDEDEDEGEDENNVDAKASADDPPPKRTKVQQP
ncbi:EKC/KEOPS complex subunit GON7, partial [Eudyptes schlegeli]